MVTVRNILTKWAEKSVGLAVSFKGKTEWLNVLKLTPALSQNRPHFFEINE